MQEIKSKKSTIENVLCVFLILCPILDMLSFLFRKQFATNWSPSTFIRPLIPMLAISYLFFKDKMKLKIIGISILYAIYAIVHLWIFKNIQTASSYSGLAHELQYILNYTFMIVNLFVYAYFFIKKEDKKLKVSILILSGIYIVSIFLAILSGTSSSTYIEGIGYKGWFESGNSISSILILALFIVLNLVKEKKYRYWVIGITGLIGIYLTTLIGTRVGLFGFVIVLCIYVATEIFIALLHRLKLNKYSIIGSVCAIVIVIVVVGMVGSNTVQRRKHLKEIESNIVDEQTNTVSHITGSLMELKEKIDNNELPEGYLSKPAKQSILDLYQYANVHQVVNNDLRTQQLIYNMYLVKNQANIGLVVFGNGYMANYRELVLEMEIPAFLFNFGMIGFMLYFVPFLVIFLYGVWIGLKNIKKLDAEYIILLAGCFFSFVFGFLSGYTFFNSSTMMLIVVLNVLLINKVLKIKQEEQTKMR